MEKSMSADEYFGRIALRVVAKAEEIANKENRPLKEPDDIIMAMAKVFASEIYTLMQKKMEDLRANASVGTVHTSKYLH
jgi:hypothetical protein